MNASFHSPKPLGRDAAIPAREEKRSSNECQSFKNIDELEIATHQCYRRDS
jgi:hypothetical protein